MTREDRIAEVLGACRERIESGDQLDIRGVLESNPDIAESLHEHFEMQELVDRFFDVDLPADPMAPPPTLGDYRIVRQIGRGGMGVVYEAEQVSMSRRVALKVLFPTIASTRRTRKRFEREARVTGKLHHTNIVTVHGMGQEAGYLYFAMELVLGEPLDQVIEELRALRDGRLVESVGVADSLDGRTSYRRIASMFAGVADALQVAHAQGVIHRDVKPSNLVLDEEGVLKLTDFGLAHLSGEGFGVTRTGEIIGTPLYMSPEQVRARREEVDLRTDVYSLGVTLYELLARERPYDGADVGTVCSQILTQEPRRLRDVDPHIPRDMAVIVHKAIEKERVDRYPSAGAMARDLRAFSERRSIEARPIGLGRRLLRKVRRHKVRTSLIAAVLLLLTAAGVLGVLASDEHDLRVLEEAQRLDREYEDLLAKAETEWPAQPHMGDPASDPLEKAIALRPGRPEAYFVRSMRSELGGARRPLGARFADLEAAAARGMAPRTIHLARAWHFYAYRQVESAEREVELALHHAAGCVMDVLLEAEIARHRGERERALGLYREVMAAQRQARPLVRRAALRLSGLYESEGDFKRALEYLSSASKADERAISEVLRLASLWDRIGARDEAQQELERVLQAVTPKHGVALWAALLRDAESRCRPTWITQIAEAGLRQHPEAPELHYWRAMGLKRTHQPEKALEVLKEAQRFAGEEPSPNLGLLHHMRAKALLDLGRVPEGLAEARKAVPLLPKVEGPLATLCAALLMAGKTAEALEPGRQAVALGPGTWWAHEQLAKAFMLNRDVEGALSAFDAAHRVAPGQAGVARQYAEALTAVGRVDDALAVLDTALRANPKDPDLQGERYFTLERAGRKEQAEAQAKALLARSETALTATPDSAPHLTLKGLSLQWLGENAKALDAFKASLDLDASSWRTWFQRAYVHGKLGQTEEELNAYRKAVQLNPRYAAAWGNLSALLSEAGEHAEALEATAAVVRSSAEPVHLHTAHHNRGMTFIRMERHDDAVGAFERALTYKPGDAESLGGIADARHQQGRFLAAAAAYEKAVEADPSHEGRWNSWAMSFILAKRFEQAVGVLEKGLEKHPHSNDLNANRAFVLFNNPQFPGVVGAFEKWVAACPKSRQAWGCKTQFHMGLEEYDEVVACADKTLELWPNDPSALESRARGWLKKGEHRLALADFETMLAQGGGRAGGVMNVAWFLATCPDLELRDTKRAALLADRALRRFAEEGGTQPAAFVLAAWVFERAGRPPEAVLSLLDKYLRAAPADGERRGHALYGLAAASARKGDVAAATRWFDQAGVWAKAWIGAHPEDGDELLPFREDAEAALEAAGD